MDSRVCFLEIPISLMLATRKSSDLRPVNIHPAFNTDSILHSQRNEVGERKWRSYSPWFLNVGVVVGDLSTNSWFCVWGSCGDGGSGSLFFFVSGQKALKCELQIHIRGILAFYSPLILTGEYHPGNRLDTATGRHDCSTPTTDQFYLDICLIAHIVILFSRPTTMAATK